jgi:hypothetical protein
MLVSSATPKVNDELTTNLSILATLEKGRHTDKSDVVVPHDRVLRVVIGHGEFVPED